MEHSEYPEVIQGCLVATLTMANVLKWTSSQEKIFREYFKEHKLASVWPYRRNMESHIKPLVERLGLSIFENALTGNGSYVMHIVHNKVEKKLIRMRHRLEAEKKRGNDGRRRNSLASEGNGNIKPSGPNPSMNDQLSLTGTARNSRELECTLAPPVKELPRPKPSQPSGSTYQDHGSMCHPSVPLWQPNLPSMSWNLDHDLSMPPLSLPYIAPVQFPSSFVAPDAQFPPSIEVNFQSRINEVPHLHSSFYPYIGMGSGPLSQLSTAGYLPQTTNKHQPDDMFSLSHAATNSQLGIDNLVLNNPFSQTFMTDPGPMIGNFPYQPNAAGSSDQLSHLSTTENFQHGINSQASSNQFSPASITGHVRDGTDMDFWQIEPESWSGRPESEFTVAAVTHATSSECSPERIRNSTATPNRRGILPGALEPSVQQAQSRYPTAWISNQPSGPFAVHANPHHAAYDLNVTVPSHVPDLQP